MSPVCQLTHKSEIEPYLRRCPHLNYYHLGDLDDCFWPHTRWYAWQAAGETTAIVLLYTAPDPPVLLAILNDNLAHMRLLLAAILPELPPQVYTHLSPGLADVLQATRYTLTHHGAHDKMVLTSPESSGAAD